MMFIAWHVENEILLWRAEVADYVGLNWPLESARMHWRERQENVNVKAS